MPAAEREALVLERIRQVMAYAWARAPFYRRKWEQAGIHPSSVRSLQDFERVPVVTKAELRRAQEEDPPFGDYLCVEPSEIFHVHGTSGTTGRPTAFGISRRDWVSIANAHARVMWGMGVRPTDTVFIGSFFSLYMGSWGVLAGAERLGARCFPFGAGVPGQTERAVSWMVAMRPSCFYGTPSYGIHLAEVAAGMEVDPRSFGLRLLFFSGEPGASVPAIRRKLEDLYGAPVFDSGSMAEMSPWMSLGESSARAGMLCWQDVVYTEVCSPETLTRMPFGGEGTPVYTHLERTSQPMIRLLSGDLTRWEAGPSPCGRTYPILPRGIYGRIDDQFTVRGENIMPSTVDEVVVALEGYGGEHRILVSRDEAMDELTVQIEHGPDVGDVEGLRRLAELELRRALGVSLRVVMVAPGTLERTEFKARRVIDSRDILRRAPAWRGKEKEDGG
jgi:phenylacetate-CoA ligase